MTDMDTNDIFLTDKETAEILKTSVRHVRRMFRAGLLKGKDISLGSGKRRMIRLLKEDVIAYVKSTQR